MDYSRRAMIKDGLLAVTAGMVMPSVFARAVRASHNAAQEGDHWALASQNRVLIVVQLAGGNDGLNTVIPYTQGLYYQARPTLGIKQDKVLDLNGVLGLHPAMKSLKALWDQKRLAIVEGVGYEHPSLSHFTAMDIWQTVDLAGQGASGWLGKYVSGLVDQDGHPFQALAVSNTLPTALRALNADVPVLSSIANYQLQPDPAATAAAQGADPRIQTLLRLYSTYPKSAPYAALLDLTAQNAVTGASALKTVVSQYQAGAQYPNNNFAKGLQVLAEVIVQGLGLRVGYVTLGGFDTHATQDQKAANTPGRHSDLLTELSDGLAAFYADLQAHTAADNVVVMTWSEFGRRVHENGSNGTDHGTAAPLFVLGNPVQGGIYGETPSLSDLDSSGNLKYTVDFRSVYATVLDRWLGAPADAVLGAHFGDQSFLPGH